MKEKFEPIFVDGQMIDLNTISQAKISELKTILSQKQDELRRKIDEEVKKTGDKQELNNLLNELKQVQETLKILSTVRFNRITSEKVSAKISKKRSEVQLLATKYGQDVVLAESALIGFEESLEGVRTEYEDEVKASLVVLGECEKNEFSATVEARNTQDEIGTLGEEAQAELTEKTLELAKRLAQIDRTRRAGTQISEYLDESSSRCNDTLDSLTDETSLVKAEEKKGIFSGFFCKILDKINGKSKFEENAIKPVENKTKAIQRIIPIIKESITKQLIAKLTEMCKGENGTQMKAMLMEKVTEIMPMIKEGAVTAASIIASTTGLQTITIAGLAAVAAIATKVIVDKVKESKQKSENQVIDSGEVR